MAKLKWNQVGEKRFETGISEVALFVGAPSVKSSETGAIKGVAWDGVTKMDESPDGGDANDQYANNIKWLSLRGNEDYKGSIGSLMYPEEFEPCVGNVEIKSGTSAYFGQQSHSPFSFCYKTIVGSDSEGLDYSEKLHIVWNATASPVDKSYESVNDSPEGMELSWDFETTPLEIGTINGKKFKPSAHFEMTKTEENATVYQALCDKLYGTDSTESVLLLPSEVVEIIAPATGS